MKSHRTEVREGYWLGEHYSNPSWDRFTLFREKQNPVGSGSVSWPVAEFDIVEHPPRDGCNRHTEIKISIRNDIKSNGDGIEVDKNRIELRHPQDILDVEVINEVVNKLENEGIASQPLSVYVCMRHVVDFRVEGPFWLED